ncbi:ribose 5-phosphate isomerase B [Anaerolentibacter hominis]|uniref:ribose 5-phosphate isomerase B n=1 Tax=Anaerolentibacter hominis TaxID=3079009 RepID=UPI0031B8A0BB
MIALACDHAALELKNRIREFLTERGIEWRDYGTESADPVDYPVYGYAAAKAVADGVCEKGILFCGTGIGISLSANKVKGIRCAVCSDCYSARLSREHNDTNMLALGARVVGTELAVMIVESWLAADFQGGIHAKRLGMIERIENGMEPV